MENFTTVVIAIQARSTSKRFPRKVFETIDGTPMLDWILKAAGKAVLYGNTFSSRTKVITQIALCVPYGDDIVAAYCRRYQVIEGPEEDVLTRYMNVLAKTNANYVVRITADCPMLPPYLISKHIKVAVQNSYDYLSNVDEESRTAPDGFDVEVISKQLLQWLNDNATDPRDREHVTLLARRSPPGWARVGNIVNFLDLSHLKYSVDTPEDLERVRAHVSQLKIKNQNAKNKSGPKSVHHV